MIYKTWHERERLQWHSPTATRTGKRERESRTEEARTLKRETGTIYVREGVKRAVQRDRERRAQRRVFVWWFHYGDVSLRQTYAFPPLPSPLTSRPLSRRIYLALFYIYTTPRNS